MNKVRHSVLTQVVMSDEPVFVAMGEDGLDFLFYYRGRLA